MNNEEINRTGEYIDLGRFLESVNSVRSPFTLQLEGRITPADRKVNYVELALPRQAGKTTSLIKFAKDVAYNKANVLYVAMYYAPDLNKMFEDYDNIETTSKDVESTIHKYLGKKYQYFDYVLLDEAEIDDVIVKLSKYHLISERTKFIRFYTPMSVGDKKRWWSKQVGGG